MLLVDLQVSKGKAVNGELMPVNRNQEVSSHNQQQNKPSDAGRVAQLEQNIKFLQEQHQLMLTGLHKEIDNLRHRNRGIASIYTIVCHIYRQFSRRFTVPTDFC